MNAKKPTSTTLAIEAAVTPFRAKYERRYVGCILPNKPKAKFKGQIYAIDIDRSGVHASWRKKATGFIVRAFNEDEAYDLLQALFLPNDKRPLKSRIALLESVQL